MTRPHTPVHLTAESLAPPEPAPALAEGGRVFLTADPPRDPPHLLESRLVHLDEPSGRLIVASPDGSHASTSLDAAVGASLLVLVARPGEALFARPCVVEAQLAAAGWLLLYPTAAWRPIERRRTGRTSIVLPVVGYRYPATGGGLPIRGVVRDLSMSGFLLESARRVGLGDLLVLTMPLPDGPIQLRGLVVRVHPSDPPGAWWAGCHFEALTPTEEARLSRLVDRQA